MGMQGNTVCVLRDGGYGRHMHMHMWGGGKVKEGLERGDAKYRKSTLGVTEHLMFVLPLHFEGRKEGRVSGCEGPAKASEGAREEAKMIRGNADKREFW